MSFDEIEAAVMRLPENQRARLAGELLTSLPAILVDDDDGMAEARRRSGELKEDPDSACSWEDIKRNLGR
jgi:putative addiction module component (TIGR02574 family)